MVMNPEIWRYIFDAIDDPAFLHDAEYRVLLANRAYCREAGVSEAEALGKPCWEVFPRGTGPLPGCRAALETGHPGEQEEVSAGEKLFLSTGYAVRDDQGTLLCFLCILSDITAQRQAETALRRANEEQRVRSRIAEIFLTVSDEEMYARVLDIILPAMKSKFGVFGYLDESGALVVPTMTRMVWDKCQVPDKRFVFPRETWGESSWPRAIREKRTICINEASTLTPEGHVPITRHISLPLVHRGEAVGLIQVANKDSDYAPEDIALLESIGGMIAPILDARLKAEMEKAARQRADERLTRLNRMYRTTSLCNQALVRAGDELRLAREMCRVLVEKGEFRAAWVGYADAGAGKHIRPVAVAGIEQGEIEAMNLTWEDSEHGQGPSGAAVRTGKTVASLDILNDPLWKPWHEQGKRLGLVAAIVIPLQIDGKTFGVMGVYGSEANMFAPDMRKLLAELAGDLAFGIGNLRARAEHMGILEKLEHSLDHAVTAIAATVEMRDPYTAGHQRRVALLATAIAKEMRLDENFAEGLRMAGVVHDIGKIHVPAEILASPAKLTDAEFEIIKTHSKAGYEILKGIDFPWPVAEIVYQHHEKLDGSGYPRGLKGEEILLEARILTVADVIEAMASHRPYRPGFGIFPALQEISRGKNKLYDAAVVEACLKLFMEKNYEM